jgi:hypothetical protein
MIKHGLSKEIAFARYTAQRHHCLNRGIPFKFTYEEWTRWWFNHLGPDWLNKRGRRKGQYCMARKGDLGPYEAGNVDCVLASKNCSDRAVNGTASRTGIPGRANGRAKLTEDQVRKIRASRKSQRQLAAKYNISKTVIGYVKTGKLWRHV